jgi:hypothetical protein
MAVVKTHLVKWNVTKVISEYFVSPFLIFLRQCCMPLSHMSFLAQKKIALNTYAVQKVEFHTAMVTLASWHDNFLGPDNLLKKSQQVVDNAQPGQSRSH